MIVWPVVMVGSGGSGFTRSSCRAVRNRVGRERDERAVHERTELSGSEDEEEHGEREQEQDEYAARDDQAAVIDGLVHVGLADGLRGPAPTSRP